MDDTFDLSSSLSPNEEDSDYVSRPKLNQKQRRTSVLPSLARDEANYYYYGPDNSLRKRYHFCGACAFKTTSIQHLSRHVKNTHPSSTSTVSPKPAKVAKTEHSGSESDCHILSENSFNQVGNKSAKLEKEDDPGASKNKGKNKKMLFKCSLCLYTSDHIRNMASHEEAHNRNHKYKCAHCSYSSNYMKRVQTHSESYHLQDGSIPASTSSSKENDSDCLEVSKEDHTFSVKLESAEEDNRKSNNILSVRKSQSTLDRFFGRSPTIKVKTEEEEAHKKKETKLLGLKRRIQVMKQKVEVAQKELEEISSKKKDVQEKMNEFSAKEGMPDELQSLKQKKNSLAFDGEVAEGSLIGANQVLHALMSELNAL